MFYRISVITAIVVGLLSNANGQSLEPLVSLSQDLSRAELAEMATRLANPDETQTFGLGPPFVFGTDRKPEKIYGIDISHHNFGRGKQLDWGSLKSLGVSFVFMKASEGSRYADSTLQPSWLALRKVFEKHANILAGAYHFLSADIDPAAQAGTFLRVLRERTDWRKGRDMAPAVDLEQDCWRDPAGRVMRDAKGNCAGDYWTKYTPEQIAEKVLVWISVVEKELGVKPIIYTNAQWWESVRLSNNKFVSGYPMWIADYSRRAHRNGTPALPPGYSATIWQFSDNGKLDPSCDPLDRNSRCVDSNVVMLDKNSFEVAVGVAQQ